MQKIKMCLLLPVLLMLAFGASAAVSEYAFVSSMGTFTEISGGTVLGVPANDNESFNAIPLGFTFTYNGVAYTDISVQSNGFLAMGLEVLTTFQPISVATGTNNVVAALSRDIKGRDNGELMYLLSGTAPNRIFTVQWKHYRRTPTANANDDFTFQIQLLENGNAVKYVYGPFIAITSVASAAIQVGIRGATNADFSNRTTTTDWSATTSGAANTNTCTLSATVFPANGLTFSFTPPATGEPPLPAQNPVPANNATNVSITANLSWVSGGGTVDGYKVYLGTDTPPSNIVNGTIQTGITYNPADFSYSTTYYWRIVPFNTTGDALNCPIWSFTTMADPTVSTFPYNQNFDTVTPPALPAGWTTINANNDAYTWETFAGTFQSSPNSVRIRYNSNLAMNDWLLMPPMQLIQNTSYKIVFFYRATSADYPEKLALYWGNAPTVAGLTEQIFVNDNITQVAYTRAEVIVTPDADGIYYFGFKGFSAADMFYLYLDTISISIFVEQLHPPRNLSAVVDEFDVHLTWLAPLPQRALLGYNVYRNDVLIANVPSPTTLTYDDTDLSSGFHSYKVTAVYTSGESIPVGPVLVEVDPVILPPLNLTGTNIDRNVLLEWGNPEGDWFTWSNMTLGNSVGTNSAAIFDVAQRWTQADLTDWAGRSISRIEFVPAFANCIYTIKIWTGGSAAGAGTLVHSQVVSNPVMNVWNTVILNAIIPIPGTGDLYFGYEVNTQGGNPAGCDSGPPIEGKGNMMYFGGVWTTLTQLAPTLTYNWHIRAFAQYTAAPEDTDLMALIPTTEYSLNPEDLVVSRFEPSNTQRVIIGYKVYRDGVLLATLADEEADSYLDTDLPNAIYSYDVVSFSPAGVSLPATVVVEVDFQMAQQFFADGFEDHPDFAIAFAPWTLRDMDNSPTYGITDVTFPGSGGAMAYIIFNPSATTPPITTLTPHGGSKMAASFAATTPPNNDWMVTPKVHLGTNSAIKFFARSHTDTYGLERFRVGVSTLPTIITQGFTFITGAGYIEAPVGWTEYVYDLSAWDEQSVFIAIRCVSNDAFVFYVDDFSIHSDGGTVGIDDGTAPQLQNALIGNYPNPFNPS
ncbi:MAG: choice-of-anchor J domain-containing protein, partial [Candidatus Cloacimonadaceae bacterium]|nr:choice-of-anchor J domain-containing protein [Candidatus Cloacimonadaceae bacterium]